MYRSFVTCDDPKGVVECGTIRKSKVAASNKMEDKLRNRRRDKSSKKEEMARPSRSQNHAEEDYPIPCSFQLLEVSRGAQKLNQLIDSWSKGLSYEASRGQSKDVAKELLKGALDLQDSLTMLGKLQEASHYVSKLKKKQKEKLERGRFDEVWCERTNSYRFGYHDPRLSADVSSGDSIGELRNAIRDGFARQNLVRSSSARRVDSGSCMASSSSLHSTDSFISQTALQKKGKAPNLIAKLMGLEDIPSEPLMKPPHRQMDMENKKWRRPDFDVEVPKVGKPQPVPNKVDLQRTTTLEEILETAQYQGLLRGTSANEHKSRSHQPTEFHSRRKSVDDVHPIVLIKPLRVPCFNPEEALRPIIRGDGGIDTKMMLRRMRIRQWLGPGSIDDTEVTSKGIRMHFGRELEEIPTERIIQEEGAKDHMKVDLIPEEKEVRTFNQRPERAVNTNKVLRKVEVEKTQVIRHSHEERAKEHKEVSKRTEEKEAKKKRRDSSPSKTDGSNVAAHKQLKEEITDKKVDKVQKVVTSSSRKPVERESLSGKNVLLKSEDQTKLTSTKLRKPGNGSITTDEHLSQQRSSTRKTISKHTTQTKIYSSKDRKQKEKPARDNTAAVPVPESLECKEEEKRIDVTCEIHSEKKESAIAHVNEPFIEEEENVSEFRVEEHCGQSQSSICSISTLSSEYGEDVRPSNEADNKMTEIRIDDTSYKGENRLKKLLLSSPTFVNLAEELFQLNLSYPENTPPSGVYDQGVTDTKISSDYAEEFMERRSLPDSQTRHPLLSSCMGNPRIPPLSIDQLVEEIHGGVETLESYRKVAFDEIRADSLYGILDRDMSCRGVVSGIWDFGWRNGFSVDEIEQAVNDLETLLVSELIGEVFS